MTDSGEAREQQNPGSTSEPEAPTSLSKPYTWTLAEIKALPEFGSDSGWFYGLVCNHETGRVWLYEIFPGMGYASPYLRTPRLWWQAAQDIRQTPRRKAFHRERRAIPRPERHRKGVVP